MGRTKEVTADTTKETWPEALRGLGHSDTLGEGDHIGRSIQVRVVGFRSSEMILIL